MVRVLILGTGGIAANHVEAFAAIPAVTLSAGVDTRPGPLAEFCDRFGIAARFTSLEEASPSVRAVSMDAGAKLLDGAQGLAGQHPCRITKANGLVNCAIV